MRSLKHAVQSQIKKLGIHIERTRDPHEDQRALLGGQATTIFDCGGNEGQTVARYRSLFPTAHIHSFEPVPEMFGRISNRFAQDDRIHPAMIAVSEEPGELPFYEYNLTGFNSFELCTQPHVHVVKETRVPVTTLDLYCEQNQVAHVDILKLDIQGAELRALKGASKLLSSGRISIVYSEVMFGKIYKEQSVYHEIASFLADHGYHMFRFYDLRYAPNRSFDYCDAIFAREDIYKRGLSA